MVVLLMKPKLFRRFLEFPDIILQTSISEALERRGAPSEMTAWLTFIKCSSLWVHWRRIAAGQACGVSLRVCQGWNLEPVWKKPCMRVQAAGTITTCSNEGQRDDCVSVSVHACGPEPACACLCTDLRLCGWAHSDMSQATSRPHKSASLGGGILM